MTKMTKAEMKNALFERAYDLYLNTKDDIVGRHFQIEYGAVLEDIRLLFGEKEYHNYRVYQWNRKHEEQEEHDSQYD